MSTAVPVHTDPLRLAFLQSVRTYPAVSVLVSIGDDRSPVGFRLGALIREAAARLGADHRAGDTAALVDALRRLAEDTPVDTGAAALALYVSVGTAHAVHLPVGVRDRVVVDETFATRDLVHARARSPRYRVLALGESVCRLYEGLGGVLEQVHDGGFPVDLGQPDQPQRLPRVGHERKGRREQQLRLTVQTVDAALAALVRDDPTPLFVVGAERRAAAVRDSSRHRSLVTGVVARSAERLGVAALGQLVAPHVEAMLARHQVDALVALDEARGARRYAAGIREVWPLAAEGRGSLLVVEQGFAYPARVDALTNTVEGAADITKPDVVDDLVDEAIEAVLGARGRAVIVPDGALADAERIAMVVRW